MNYGFFSLEYSKEKVIINNMYIFMATLVYLITYCITIVYSGATIF